MAAGGVAAIAPGRPDAAMHRVGCGTLCRRRPQASRITSRRLIPGPGSSLSSPLGMRLRRPLAPAPLPSRSPKSVATSATPRDTTGSAELRFSPVMASADVKTRRGRWYLMLASAVGTSVIAAAAALSAVVSYQRTRVPPTTSGFSSQVLEKCPSLTDYDPVPGLTNAHVETIFSAKFRADPGVEYQRTFLTRDCGGVLAIDWPVDRSIKDALPAADDAPVLMVISGLSGGSHDPYVQHQMIAARQRGYKACVMNCRGCGGAPITSPRLFSAGYTEDIRVTINHLKELHPNSPLVACGWSLGGNMLIRYLGEEGSNCPLAAAVSACNPFNLNMGMDGLKRGFSRIYDYNLARRIASDLISPYKNVFEGRERGACLESALKSTSLTEFDEYVTRRHFGFTSVDEYYDKSGSHWSIPDVRVPLLVVNAANDPVSPVDAIPMEKINANPYVATVITKGGGHLGWVSQKEGLTGAPWPNRGIIEWISAELEVLRDTPEKNVDEDHMQMETMNELAETESSVPTTPEAVASLPTSGFSLSVSAGDASGGDDGSDPTSVSLSSSAWSSRKG